MSSYTAQPDRRPDLRAIITEEERLLVVPWRPELLWSELQAGPVSRDPILGIPGASSRHHNAIFEIWRHGVDCFARQIGGDSAEDRSRGLRDWVEAQGGLLTLGPRLPDLAPDPTPIRLSYRDADSPPDFRFVFEPARGDRLRITPWGFSDLRLDRIVEPWQGVVGDVIATDRDTARAYLARSTPRLREAAERALHTWASLDSWELQIEPDLAPLTRPVDPPVTHAAYCRCRDCGERRATGWASHLRFGGTDHQPTRCRICHGRYVWFEQTQPSEASRPS